MQFPVLLFSYLIAVILAPLFASFIILNCVLFLGKMIPFLDFLLDFGIEFSDFARLCAYLTPQMFLFSIPMASMIGVIIGFTRIANDGEIMALKAGGIGLYSMLPPVIIVSLCAAALTGLFSTHLIPTGNIAMEKLLFQLAKEKIDKGLREKQFSDAMGSVVLYADHINKENMEWQGVYVTDTRDRDKPVVILAQTGTLSADIVNMSMTLILKKGSLHRVDNEITQNIRFERYTINLSLPSPVGTISATSGKKSYTQKQLLEKATHLGTDTEEGASLLIEYHKRLALPVGCLILSLLGFPLAFISGPGQRSVALPLGLIFFILYFIAISGAKAMSESLLIPVSLAMWSPNIIYGFIMIYLVRAIARETLPVHLEKLYGTGRKLTRYFQLFRK